MKAIIKSDIYFFKNQSKYQNLVYYKRDFNNVKKVTFRQQLSLLHRLLVSFQKDVNQMYGTFLNTFLEIYKTNFSYKQVVDE